MNFIKTIFFFVLICISYSACSTQKNTVEQNPVERNNATTEKIIFPPPPPPPPPPPSATQIYKVVERMPRFPGCEYEGSENEKKKCSEEEFLKFIYKNLEYPVIAKENNIEGTCIVTFVIEKDGSVSNVKSVRKIGGGCDEEAVRVINLMNIQGIKWTIQGSRGRNVRVQFNVPIKFELPKE